MMLTDSEKKHLLRVLWRDQRRLLTSPSERDKSKQLYEKIRQTLRNEEVNKDHR
ncbi:hypothetical protein [Salibacterium aidingense]|uniref:hypothetical protein n=1 Tax=Salibacterium aidingense TaxID=384933 RepID=UPI000424C301|nr:hypothetical protein [Salibacterium aidingense]